MACSRPRPTGGGRDVHCFLAVAAADGDIHEDLQDAGCPPRRPRATLLRSPSITASGSPAGACGDLRGRGQRFAGPSQAQGRASALASFNHGVTHGNQRGSTWQADVTLNGGKRLRPGGFTSQAEAELWEAQAKANDEKGLPHPPVPSPRAATSHALNGISLGELRDMLLTTPKLQKGLGGWKGSKDYRNAEARSQYAVDFFGADKQASSINFNELERYSRALRTAGTGQPRSTASTANVSKMISFAVHRGLISVRLCSTRGRRKAGCAGHAEASGAHQLEVMGAHDLPPLDVPAHSGAA